MLTGCWCSSMSKIPACKARRGSGYWRRQLWEAQPCRHTCRTDETIKGNTELAILKPDAVCDSSCTNAHSTGVTLCAKTSSLSIRRGTSQAHTEFLLVVLK